MRILVVEDDENKRSQIVEFIETRMPGADLYTSAALVSGLLKSREVKPDLIILDMTLPNYESNGTSSGGLMHPFGGREFLRQTARSTETCKIIIVTQFESFGDPPNVTVLSDLDLELSARFPEHYAGAVYYHASINEWMEKLVTLIQRAGLVK